MSAVVSKSLKDPARNVAQIQGQPAGKEADAGSSDAMPASVRNGIATLLITFCHRRLAGDVLASVGTSDID